MAISFVFYSHCNQPCDDECVRAQCLNWKKMRITDGTYRPKWTMECAFNRIGAPKRQSEGNTGQPTHPCLGQRWATPDKNKLIIKILIWLKQCARKMTHASNIKLNAGIYCVSTTSTVSVYGSHDTRTQTKSQSTNQRAND